MNEGNGSDNGRARALASKTETSEVFGEATKSESE